MKCKRTQLPMAIQEFYQRNGDWEKIERVTSQDNDASFRVYFGDAYDKWTKVGNDWAWAVGYS